MDEATVRQAASMWALVAEMESIKAGIEAMKVENVERERGGFAMAWPYNMFQDAADALKSIAEKLRNEI